MWAPCFSDTLRPNREMYQPGLREPLLSNLAAAITDSGGAVCRQEYQEPQVTVLF